MQFETAVLYNKFDTGNSAVICQALLRYGVAKNSEISLLSENGRERNRYIDETVQSIYPVAVGAKISLVKATGWIPDITLAAYLHLPFTSKGEQENIYWSPLFIMALQNKLGKKWNLEYNIDIQKEAYSTAWNSLFNASLQYQFIPRLELFAEYYAQYHIVGLPQNNLGGGVSFQLNNHWNFF